MINARAAAAGLAVSIAVSLSGGGVAHAEATPASASAAIRKPVTIARLRDLDFGSMIATAAAGTVQVDPQSGTRTVGGGALEAGGTVQAAQFRIVASPATLVLITRNALPVLTRSGGGGTMSVTLLTLAGPSNPVVMPSSGSLDIDIGGILSVKANQADGTYSGTFQINANYQ